MGHKYCMNCGNKLTEEDVYCPECGAKNEESVEDETIAQKPVSEQKNPILALLLSLIIPGVGQFYNGQTQKGLYLLVGFIISAFLILLYIGYILSIVVWIYGMYDAYTSAEKLNAGEIVEDKLF